MMMMMMMIEKFRETFIFVSIRLWIKRDKLKLTPFDFKNPDYAKIYPNSNDEEKFICLIKYLVIFFMMNILIRVI